MDKLKQLAVKLRNTIFSSATNYNLKYETEIVKTLKRILSSFSTVDLTEQIFSYFLLSIMNCLISV